MADRVQIEVPTPLNVRLVKLAEIRAHKLGVSTLSRPKFLEILVSEEEKRNESENKKTQTSNT